MLFSFGFINLFFPANISSLQVNSNNLLFSKLIKYSFLGTVSKWYFTRDKTKLDSPILSTFNDLVRFHLGSVCMGSMIITYIKILRMLIKILFDSNRNNGGLLCSLFCGMMSSLNTYVEEFLKYLFRNAYILVAKDGTSLYESGCKAFDLIFRHLKDIIIINLLGDAVLFVGKIFITAIASIVGYFLLVSFRDFFN